jgi:hypothetical protein
VRTHLCTRLRDGSEVVDQICLGHTNTSVAESEGFVLLVGGDTNIELLARVEDGGVSQRSITDFIKGIRRVRDQLAQEDLFVRVERILEKKQGNILQDKLRGITHTNDKIEELADLSLESKAFGGHLVVLRGKEIRR